MVEPYNLSLTEASNQIHTGDLTPQELLESLLRRINSLESMLEAWVTVNIDGAREAAKKLTREANKGEFRSTLHGIPVGVKDIYFTKGLRTTMGSPIYSGFVPQTDASIVTRLKEAGAIIMGKTETTEFAFLDPAPTRNPWNTKHTPGGSSSGSAAAVAARMCPLAFGSQTGGSVTRPASFCGIAGIKPTYDLLSREGVYPLAWSLDHIGFMARNVADLTLTLGVLTGKKGLGKPRKPKIGLLTTYFNEAAEKEVASNFKKAIQSLRGSGAEVVEVDLPETFKLVHSAHRVIMFAESAAVHEENHKMDPSAYRINLRSQIVSGLTLSSSTYLRAQRIRGIFTDEMREAMEGVDVLITPSAPTPALRGLSSTGDAAFNVPWSLTGFPTVNIPSGLTKDGLPLGVQLVAQPYEEKKLLSESLWCEAALPFDAKPSLQ